MLVATEPKIMLNKYPQEFKKPSERQPPMKRPTFGTLLVRLLTASLLKLTDASQLLFA